MAVITRQLNFLLTNYRLRKHILQEPPNNSPRRSHALRLLAGRDKAWAERRCRYALSHASLHNPRLPERNAAMLACKPLFLLTDSEADVAATLPV